MTMTDHLMGPFVRRFLLEDLVADRNLSPNTQKSYRDTIRLLFSYVAEHHKTIQSGSRSSRSTRPSCGAFSPTLNGKGAT